MPTCLRAAAVAAALAAAAPARAQLFDFTNAPLGAVTPVAQTSEGLTATFAAGVPGTVFAVREGIFPFFAGRWLGSVGPNPLLLIAFDQPLSAVAVPFLASPGAPTATLEAYLGATLVGRVTVTGRSPVIEAAAEGVLPFAGGAFDNVRVLGVLIGVDNVAATVVPEPGTWALVGAGLAGVAAARRRRRRPGAAAGG